MAKYRKKSVVISAGQWDGSNLGEVEREIGLRMENVIISLGVLKIHTLEGIINVNPGDYIIRGVRNKLCSCKEDIFEEVYERVDDET